MHGDIHWADLPIRGGHVQAGRRPVIIWQDTQRFRLPTTIVIPLTTQVRIQRLGGCHLVQPTSSNNLSAPSVALAFQVTAIDTNWISARLGRLDDSDLAAIQQLAKDLQKLP